MTTKGIGMEKGEEGLKGTRSHGLGDSMNQGKTKQRKPCFKCCQEGRFAANSLK